jgi:sugar phosphate isomerase/epimerase
MKLRLSATVWPFKWLPPYEEAIKRVANLGYRAIELIAWNRKIIDEYFTKERIGELREIFDLLGLELSALHGITISMASPEKRKRDEAISFFRKQVEVASELETKTVINIAHWPWQDDPNYPYPRIMDRPLTQTFRVSIPYNLNWKKIFNNYIGALRQCVEISEKAGLRYALEPHPFMTMSNSDAMLRILDSVKSNAFGANFDAAHFFSCGEIPQLTILKLSGRIFHCHFSDNDGATNVHWNLGKGKIDWESVLRALKATNFDGFISVELEDVFGASTHKVTEPASSFLDREYILAKEYLENLAIKVE